MKVAHPHAPKRNQPTVAPCPPLRRGGPHPPRSGEPSDGARYQLRAEPPPAPYGVASVHPLTPDAGWLSSEEGPRGTQYFLPRSQSRLEH
jgi:hypothetical protein